MDLILDDGKLRGHECFRGALEVEAVAFCQRVVKTVGTESLDSELISALTGAVKHHRRQTHLEGRRRSESLDLQRSITASNEMDAVSLVLRVGRPRSS